MAISLNFQGKSLTVQETLPSDLYIVQELRSSLFYTAKYIKNPSQTRLSSIGNEIKLLKNYPISHPNIISLYWVEEAEESIILLYEHCNNKTLLTYQQIQPLKVFYQLCLGINYLHSKSIVHKNLTPSNILINQNIVKIAGLEIAKEEEALLDQNEYIYGDFIDLIDPVWRSPEMQDSHLVTKQSDIWSLGAILYFMIYKKPYTGVLPDSPAQPYKDLFSMTLDPNPSKRASLESVLKKIEERNFRDVVSTGSCACFPSSRILRSGKSTFSLVQKAMSVDFKSSKDDNIKKLIRKVWAKPEKITKFYTELLKMQDLDDDIIRLKTFSLLFLYLQKAPVLAYTQSPGVLEVINYIEACTCTLSVKQRNEYFIRITHMFSIVIKMKYYMVRTHTSSFNGKFVANAETHDKILQEPQKDLVKEFIGYWETLIKFHESLASKAQHEGIRRFVRLIIAEEQTHLLEFMHTQIEKYQSLPEFSNIINVYFDNLVKSKDLFEKDQIVFPMVSINQSSQQMLEENYKIRSMSFHSIPISKKSYSSRNEEKKFTPIDLDLVEIKLQERSPTIYETAQKNSFSLDQNDLLDLDSQDNINLLAKKIDKKLKNWIIPLSKIKFIKPIGNGSSCEVWLGLYQKTQIAIKKQKSNELRGLKEFYRELRVLINLRHPNLVTFMGACLEENLCIVTEYCAGGDLFTLLHKKKDFFISWQQKLKILQEIAKGMIFLHSNSYIHRDLKSLNILLSSEINKSNDFVQLKISDFGLSREFKEDSFMTGQLGTCHWMAPEVLTSSNYTYKADVYSYSIVMYEVITRETPYKGKSHEEIRTQILLHNLRPDLSIIPPTCPPALKSLMSLCWDQNSSKRPSFSSILDILNAISISNN
jgi:serine/threonine protein kinase